MLCRNGRAWELFEVHINSLLYEEVLYLGAVQDAVIKGRKNRRDDIFERGSVSLRSALRFKAHSLASDRCLSLSLCLCFFLSVCLSSHLCVCPSAAWWFLSQYTSSYLLLQHRVCLPAVMCPTMDSVAELKKSHQTNAFFYWLHWCVFHSNREVTTTTYHTREREKKENRVKMVKNIVP